MKTRSQVSRMRTLGNFSYLLGVAFLIAAMAVNAMPAPKASAAPGFECHPSNGWTIWEPQPGTFHQIDGAVAYCAKAGSGQGGDNGCTDYDVSGSFEYVRSVINSAGTCGLSHWGYKLGEATPTTPADTATPTTPADTATPTTPADTATPTAENTATPTDELTATPTAENTVTPTASITNEPGPSTTPTATATEPTVVDTATPTTPADTATPNPGGPTSTPQPHDPSTPLIPVTGAALGGGWSTQTIFFNLGIGFLGLGLVFNGLARSRKEREL